MTNEEFEEKLRLAIELDRKRVRKQVTNELMSAIEQQLRSVCSSFVADAVMREIKIVGEEFANGRRKIV